METDYKEPRKSAREKVMDLLARRSHSELELKQKLSRLGYYDSDEITDAIEHARANRWLQDPADLSQQVADDLGRKKKGHALINEFLEAKGLPPVSKDLDEEVDKGRSLVIAKMRSEGPFNREELKKIQRLLGTRGFDEESVRKIIHQFGGTLDLESAENEDIEDIKID